MSSNQYLNNPSPSHSSPSIAYLVHTVYRPFIKRHVNVVEVAELMPCMKEVLSELRSANTRKNAWRIFEYHLKNSNDPDKYEQLSSALRLARYKGLACALNCVPIRFHQSAHMKMISLLTPGLLETFLASEVAAQLVSRGTLSIQHFELIGKLEQDGEKANACFLLVDMLARQGEGWYKHLLEVLDDCQYAKLVTDLEPTYYEKKGKVPAARLSKIGITSGETSDLPKARLSHPRHSIAVRDSKQGGSLVATKSGSHFQRSPYLGDRQVRLSNVEPAADAVTDLEPTYYEKKGKAPAARLSKIGITSGETSDLPKARLCHPRHSIAVRDSKQGGSQVATNSGSHVQRSPYLGDGQARLSDVEPAADAPGILPQAGVPEASKIGRALMASKCVKFCIPIATVAPECFAKASGNEELTDDTCSCDERDCEMNRENEYYCIPSAQTQNEHSISGPTDSKIQNNSTTQGVQTARIFDYLGFCGTKSLDGRPVTYCQHKLTFLSQKHNTVGQADFINHGEKPSAQPSCVVREQNYISQPCCLLQQQCPPNMPYQTDTINHEQNPPNPSYVNQETNRTQDLQLRPNTSRETSHTSWSGSEPKEHTARDLKYI